MAWLKLHTYSIGSTIAAQKISSSCQDRLCLLVTSSTLPVRGFTQCIREHATHITD
jgi:hypothetical protein